MEASDLEGLRPRLRIMALRALHDSDAADEAVQETLARACQALAGGRVPENLAAFVHGIARHVIADVQRRGTRERRRLERQAAEPAEDPDDPLEELLRSETRERVRVTLEGLSPGDRELLRLAYVEGLSAPEIAARLGLTPEAVRKRLERARARLRRELDGPGGSHDWW